MEQQYGNKRAVLEQWLPLEFETDEISLDINDAVISTGWEIKAPTPLQYVCSSWMDVALQLCVLSCLDFQKSSRSLHW